MAKLLVTPSKLLLQTAGVLIGTCIFVAAIILILYIKEKVIQLRIYKDLYSFSKVHFYELMFSVAASKTTAVYTNECRIHLEECTNVCMQS